MNFLLIGGIGYVGGRLASYLKSRGHRVSISTRRSPEDVPAWVIADEIIWDANGADFAHALETVDVVLHLAAPDASAAARNPAEALRAGGEWTWQLLEKLLERKSTSPLLYLSTFHVYGRNVAGEIRETTLPIPSHPYAIGKYLAECIVQFFRGQKGIRALCVRLSNVFGTAAAHGIPCNSLVFNDLCRQAIINKRLTLHTTGDQKRNFITMEDTVRALEFLALRNEEWPVDGVIHMGSKLHLSIREVAEIVAERTNALFGYSPEIITPEAHECHPAVEFTYSIERLEGMGFVWNNRVEKEVDDTLNFFLQENV